MKKFQIDRQTLDDLNLLGKYKSNSIFSLFNRTVTKGGEMALERMFLNPLTEAGEINSRKKMFEFFQKEEFIFPVDKEELDVAEQYLTNGEARSYAASMVNSFKRKAMKLIANDNELEMIQNGMNASVSLFVKLESFFKKFDSMAETCPYRTIASKALELLHDKGLAWIYSGEDMTKCSTSTFARYDYRLRYAYSSQINELLGLLYELDLYIAVAKIGRERGFFFAEAVTQDETVVSIKGLYHPTVPNAVSNDLLINHLSNLVFLTGANMAGKSTLMKAFAVTLYLAHMGFPLPVSSMHFTPVDGMYTSINVPDNLNMGYSHFYAEVKRVREVALAVSSGKRLLVIFDELFKGTNVKDAYDATVAVTEAFSKHRRCIYIVSTHIMEAGVTLKERCDNMKFVYLPTLLQGSTPVYTYRLSDGISDDRHGMMIINNERIIETIRKTTEQQRIQ
ncbi:MAG: hypothetical protein M0R37_08420 [Bacteroidales bacterium]|nr:hypothetical protein [Bacteroidales bacterium]